MVSAPDTKQPGGSYAPGGYLSLCHRCRLHHQTTYTGASELKEARGKPPTRTGSPARFPQDLVYSKCTLSDGQAAVCTDRGEGDVGSRPGSLALKN